MNTYDANGNQVCRVDQIRIQYRPVGTSAWSAKNIASPVGYDPNTGICNSTQATMKPIRNLTLATTYEWRVKVWYCSGGNGGWVDGTPFTTADECPNVANLTAYGSIQLERHLIGMLRMGYMSLLELNLELTVFLTLVDQTGH